MDTDTLRIRQTWARAIAGRDVLGAVFYDTLFTIAPETRDMFPQDMDEQGRKLVQTLSWIVDHLDQPDPLNTAAVALAERHVAYQVEPAQYGAVGEALIATLRTGLGPDFTPEDEAAWTRVYAGLSQKMIAAAYPEA